MQLEFDFMADTPYPGAPLLSLQDFALYVKTRAAESLFNEHTEWLEQWKSVLIYEAVSEILILERLDGAEWNAMAVARYAKAFFSTGKIHRIAPITASGVKRRKNIIMLTDNFERSRLNHAVV